MNTQYRTQGRHLYKFDEQSNSYVHVYAGRTTSKKKLIEEYEEYDEDE